MTLAPHAALSKQSSVSTADSRWSDLFADWIAAHSRVLWILAILSYFASFNGLWQMTPDSALYLSLGRNIAGGHGYTYNGAPHDMVYPGLPYVLAGLYKILGSDARVIAAADLLTLLAGLLTLAATFRLVRLALDRTTAHVVALGLAGVHEFYRYCYTILTDIPFLLGVMCLMAGHEAIFGSSERKSRWYDWALLLAGMILAIVMRPNMIGLLCVWIGVLIWTAWRRPPRRKAALTLVEITAALGLLFISLDPRHILSGSASSSYERIVLLDLTTNLGQRLRIDAVANCKNLFGMTAARAAFGVPLGLWWINAILGTAALTAGLALFRVRALWGWWIMVTLATLILIVSHDRYMLQISPLLVLGWWRFLSWLNRRIPGAVGNWVFAILLASGVLGNVLQQGNIMLHQHLRPFYAYYAGGDYFGYPQMGKNISELTGPDDLVICAIRRSHVLTFLSHRTVIEYTDPEAQNLSSGSLVIVFDPDDANFSQWLITNHISLEKTPLATFPRGEERSALVLTRARQNI
jgi:hypothetical protein